MGQTCILVIDDDSEFRGLLRQHLEKDGVSMFEAGDGPSGIELFRERRFDAAFIDLRMPVMDGYAVLAELAACSTEIPLIVISGQNELKHAVRAVRAGAWDFVVKDDQVLQELDHALSKSLERAAYLSAQRKRLDFETRERERAEEALRNQLGFIQAVIDAVPNQIFYKDLEGRYLGCNKAFETFVGMPRSEMVGKLSEEIVPAEEGANYHDRDAEMLQGRVASQEYEINTFLGGRNRTVVVRKALIKDMDGNPVGIVGVLSDISRLKASEERLRKSQERFRTLLETSPLPMIIVSLETGRTIFTNERAVDQLGLDRGQSVDIPTRQFYRNIKDRDRFLDVLLVEGRLADSEIEMRRTDGTTFWTQFSAVLMGVEGIPSVFIAFTDITARKDLEEAREKFEFIANASHDLMTLCDRDSRFVAANRAYLDQHGVLQENILGKTMAEVWGGAFENYIRPHFDQCLQGKAVSYSAWFSFPQREKSYYEVFMYPYWAPNGSVSHVATVTRDATERQRTEDQLREALEQVEVIQHNTIFGMALFQGENIVRINPRGAEVFGQAPEDLVGTSPERFFTSSEDYRRFYSQCVQSLAATGVFETEQEFQREDGVFIWATLAAKAVDRNDLSQGVIWTILDITERRYNETVTHLLYQISNAVTATSDLDELYERIHAILNKSINASNFFIAMLDRTRTQLEFTYFEDEFDNFKGVAFDINKPDTTSLSVEVIRSGKPLLVSTRELPPDVDAGRDGSTDAIRVVRAPFLKKLGTSEASMLGATSQVWLGVPLKVKGEVVGVMAVQSYSNPYQYSDKDVSLLLSVSEQVALAVERKGIEQDLRLARDLAEAANNSKSEFLANMSHEVRTPLNGVLGMLQLTQTTELSLEQRDYVETALSSGRSLLSIINDILDFSKIEAGKMEVVSEEFSLGDLVQDVLASLRGQALGKGISLTANLSGEIPERVIGGKSRIKQILFNLVGNAIKFTEEGEVCVEITLLRIEPGGNRLQLLFSVRDTGIGIPDEMMSLIFEPFTQVDGSYIRRHQGTGLGLGIVKRLTDLMHGFLSVESREGEGTTVHLSLGLKFMPVSPGVDGEAEERDSAESRRLSLLVVEDNRVNRLMAERMLSKLGHDVRTAENGIQALDMLEAHCFDGVFMDIQMPGMDGVEATGLIRNAGGTSRIDPKIPVIAMTAHAMIGDREMFLKCGMDDYIAKPVEMQKIKDVIRRIFYRK